MFSHSEGGIPMGLDANRLTEHIGKTLRRLRQERNWSLEELARATGVSKPMLGQIERGESNPTVMTLWKIATGLQVPFSAFLHGMELPRATLVRRSEQAVITDDGGRYNVQSVLALQQPHAADLYEATLLPGGHHRADAHGLDVREGVWVTRGHLTVVLDEAEYRLSEGDALHFPADIAHQYRNDTDTPCTFVVLLIYPKGRD
jgi:transcriptional regulator with XRE-family HTH domain